MFYNCPVRKLASHSPPSYEKKQHTNTRSHWHRHSHLLAQIHTLAGTDSTYWHTQIHKCGHMQTEIHLQRHTACTSSFWYLALLVSRGSWKRRRSRTASLSLYSLQRSAPHGPAKSGRASALGMLSPLPCVWLLAAVYPSLAQGPRSSCCLCSQWASWHPIVPGESPQGLGV